ncbi:hypothetical protein N0V90_003619 [Kalmusia sp. IMI 367209]|nr:hypothetical protein N0V90_003619 [Kalmusia sp. IMI 367209]
MTRVSRATSHRGVSAAVPLDRSRAAVRKKKPYKIVLEAVTQEKRKLKSTAKPRSKAFFDPEKISAHVHRIGHHFPLEIIELACKKFNYRYSESRGLERTRDSPEYGPAYVERGIADYEQRQRLQGNLVTDTDDKDHIRGAIREIFPKIPEADLTSIANHAFEEGTNRVGNAKGLSLARRVQLAVVAHIRHTYTEYDNILKHKTGTWTEARQRVEHVSLAKLKEWRDETDEASKELEETFREVIVLDDDEDDSSDDETSASNTREPSMEIVSNRATARDLQPELVDRMRAYDPYLSRASRRTIILRPVPNYSPRQSFVPSPTHTHFVPQLGRVDARALPPGSPVAREPVRVQAEPFRRVHGFPPPRPADSRIREPAPGGAHPTHMRDSTGRLYSQLQPIEADSNSSARTARDFHADSLYGEARSHYVSPVSQTHNHGPSRLLARQTIDPVLNQESSLHHSRPRLTPGSRRASDQDLVLPSVEREPEPPVQKRKSIPTPVYEDYPPAVYEDYAEHATKRMRPTYDTLPRYEVVDLTSSSVRPVNSNGQDIYEVARPRAKPIDYEYIPVLPREPPSRETSGAYREVIVHASPRAYAPEYDRAYDRRAVPTRDRAILNGPDTRYETRDGLYIRNSASHGYYATH